MAFKMADVNGFGTGALGTVTNPSSTINSYANVTAISTNTVTIGTPAAGIYETFTVGTEILLHVSAITTGTDLQYLGKYIFAKITAVNGSILTLDKDVSGLVASGVFANHHVQILTVAQFDTLNLTITIAPPAYSVTNKYGGILAFKCKTAFNFAGTAGIDLVAKGIPIANVAYRPATFQETRSALNGWENHITTRNMYMNCPDGIAFIAAKTSVNSGTSSKIGNASGYGVERFPYNIRWPAATDPTHKAGPDPTNADAVGGSTIMWLSETITGFTSGLIGKGSSNTSGKGLGRCYIATNSKLPADEGLYALDCLSNPARLTTLGIKDFGDGSLGNALTLSGQLNSYAPVTSISDDGKTLTIGTISAGAYDTFAAGSRVMFHVSRQTGTDVTYTGKFILATVLSVSGNTVVVLDTPVTNVVPSNVLANYKCQLITVAQFDTLALAGGFSGVKAYDDTAGCGGILAIAAKTTLDLQNGALSVYGKGIPASVSRPALSWQCPGNQEDCLPLSQGNGAVFLLAKALKLNSNSWIGAGLAGSDYGRHGGMGKSASAAVGGGSSGSGYGGGGGGGYYYNGSGESATGSGGGGGYTDSSPYSSESTANYSYGTGGHGGISYTASNTFGGYGGKGGAVGCNGGDGTGTGYGTGGYAGASVFAVADSIDGFSVAAFRTGGYGGGGTTGSGSGGGGGGTGTCFIYCNTLTNPDYTAFQTS